MDNFIGVGGLCNWFLVAGGGGDSMDCDEYWQIDGVVEFVREGGYKVVVLQFPDDLLKESAVVAKRLADEWKEAGHEAEVSADSLLVSAGSLCSPTAIRIGYLH